MAQFEREGGSVSCVPLALIQRNMQESPTNEAAPGSRYGFTRGAAYFGGEQND